MFEELCRTGRVCELATIHRFRHAWEQAASLELRAGNPDALDAYFRHGRVTAGTFDALTTDLAQRWIEHTAAGQSVAVVAETNEHVDALNHAIQQQRREHGHLGRHTTRLAGREAGAVGDVVVTRHNERTLRTDRGEPIRNRERWTVTAVTHDGSLTVSHEHGHGRVTLPADYVRQHVRLGYAATAHGHQGDTVDVSLAVVTAATTHRSLYVGATRGRQENRLLVVTDDADLARDVLEEVLTNDRADTPAVAQRRHLARQEPRSYTRDAEEALATARREAAEAVERAEPFLRPLHEAEQMVQQAEHDVNAGRRVLADAPIWRRRPLTRFAADASARLAEARRQLAAAEEVATPHLAVINAAEARVRQAEHGATAARIRDRLDQLARRTLAPSLDRGAGIGL
jgi:hypothetical protein